MEHEALKRIEELAAVSLQNGLIAGLDTPAVALPSGVKIESLEKYLQAPVRMKRTFRTNRVRDFLVYMRGQSSTQSNTSVFIESNASSAEGIIDCGDHGKPEWGDHKAQLTMEKTPEYRALLNASSDALDQRRMANFLEDWADVIKVYEDVERNNSMAMSKAITAVRKVEIKQTKATGSEVGDFNVKRSGLDEIDAKSTDGNLPAVLVMKTPLYIGTQEHDILVRLGVRTSDPLGFVLRIMGKDRLEDEVAKEIQDEIRNGLPAIKVFVGSI